MKLSCLSCVCISKKFQREGKLIQCTQRESEVLVLLAHGLSNKTIAARLGISHNTVCDHVCSLIQRHGLSNRLELAVRASTRPWQIGSDSVPYQLTKVYSMTTASKKSEWMLFR
ncbi:response regulator transcription factor [Rhodoferax lithotrophicus]|uniref:response regulator transcription factor n=1 Tax=Rhodoferax lithotrophicus TaxID=2798804 RepID=UPI001CC79625